MNEQNLIPLNQRTKSEQREIAAKGGRASAVSRSFRSATKKRLKEHPELFDEIISMLERMSLDGDLKALDLLLELSGESPKQMELALKKRELKLKENAVKAVREMPDEVPELYKALGDESGDL